MKHVLVAALLAAAAPALAAPEAQEGAPSPEGGAAFPAPDTNEAEEQGITNWWSWDYGPGAKDPHHKHLPPPFGFALVNFGIFALIMYRLAGKPLKQFVLDRHNAIKKDLDEASSLRKKAEAQLHEYENKVKGVDAEIESIVAGVRKDAEAEKARIIAAAAEQAARIKADAEKQIAAEIERATRELRRGVIEAAVQAADELLKKQIGADDQRKMAERYVVDLEKRAGRAS